MEQTASTPAVAFLIERGVPFDQLEYEHTDDFAGGFGAEASQKLGIAPAEVFKTLMVEADTGPGCVLVPVDHRMSLKKVAKALGAKKAEMMPANKAQNRTGYIVGGISPFGQKTPAPIIIDESCLNLEGVIVSGGRRGFSLRVKVTDFLEASGAIVADVLAWEV